MSGTDDHVDNSVARTHGHRPSLDVCRAALARGPLTRDGKHWRFGRRRFSNATVKQLIDDGAAVRDGDTVTRTSSS
jgi:hypothetical protein